MDLYAPICRSIVAPLWAKHERSPYLRHLRYFEQSQYWPVERHHTSQLQRLKLLLKHAYDNTDYYRSKWQEVGFHPEDLKTLNDLDQLPILIKDDIRANKQRMVAKNILPQKLSPGKTSGSTGVSLEFFVDEGSRQWKRGCTFRHDQWTGWRQGEKIAAVWGNPTHKANWRTWVRNLLLERYDYLDTLKMDEDDMLGFYGRQIKRKPTLLFGHAHSLYLFAMFLKARGLEPFKVRGIISTCMVLHDYERNGIEKVFDCKVTNRYGCEEVSLIACECEAHNALHLNLDTLIVEFIKDGEEVLPGKPGAIVVTDLTNYGMPFIRYKVGDVGIPSAHKCSCGRSLPLMERLEGRVADYVVTPDGNLVSGISLTENFAMLLLEVKQIQIIQEEVDSLVFNIVKGDSFELSSEVRISSLVQERFGSSMHHRIQYVDHISQDGSGKYRFCISNVENPFL